MITKTIKPNSKKPRKNKASAIKKRFDSVAESYGTNDPEVIKQKIMWNYIALLARVQVQPGSRPGMEYHIDHFETCNKYIQHEKEVRKEVMSTQERRLAEIDTLVMDLHKLFGDDYKDLCRRLTTDGSRLKYSMLYETVNELFGIITSKK